VRTHSFNHTHTQSHTHKYSVFFAKKTHYFAEIYRRQTNSLLVLTLDKELLHKQATKSSKIPY